ncbi:hypothetical protein [Candidatus Uabimicrobium sp. HlEnr_7]|uniref:hypothetical protein n=1 Tax=Candidatus Uabimicrobium helgolandensis TaxID=3095367 RepID=UPI003556CFFA
MKISSEKPLKQKDSFSQHLQLLYDEMQAAQLQREFMRLIGKRRRSRCKVRTSLIYVGFLLLWMIFVLQIYIWQQFVVLQN